MKDPWGPYSRFSPVNHPLDLQIYKYYPHNTRYSVKFVQLKKELYLRSIFPTLFYQNSSPTTLSISSSHPHYPSSVRFSVLPFTIIKMHPFFQRPPKKKRAQYHRLPQEEFRRYAHPKYRDLLREKCIARPFVSSYRNISGLVGHG
jgi:hypothetical protein